MSIGTRTNIVITSLVASHDGAAKNPKGNRISPPKGIWVMESLDDKRKKLLNPKTLLEEIADRLTPSETWLIERKFIFADERHIEFRPLPNRFKRGDTAPSWYRFAASASQRTRAEAWEITTARQVATQQEFLEDSKLKRVVVKGDLQVCWGGDDSAKRYEVANGKEDSGKLRNARTDTLDKNGKAPYGETYPPDGLRRVLREDGVKKWDAGGAFMPRERGLIAVTTEVSFTTKRVDTNDNTDISVEKKEWQRDWSERAETFLHELVVHAGAAEIASEGTPAARDIHWVHGESVDPEDVANRDEEVQELFRRPRRLTE